MAMKIVAEDCIACAACEPDCPVEAISESEDGAYYIIDPDVCVECEGHYDEPQCVEVCPVECIEKA